MTFEKALEKYNAAKSNYAKTELMKFWEASYRVGQPKMSDQDWDKLVEVTGYQELIGETGVSPNGRIYKDMLVPHISLKKIKISDFERFIMTMPEDNCKLEVKLDGNCVVVQYEVQEDGTARRSFIGTSGNGVQSLLVSEHALDTVDLNGIPEVLSKETVAKFAANEAVIDGRIEICGEAIINAKNWIQRNPSADLATSRNALAGIINRKMPSTIKYIASFSDVVEGLKLFKVYNPLVKRGYKEFSVVDGHIVSAVDGKILDEEILSINKKLNNNDETIDLVTYSCATKSGNSNADFLYDCDELITLRNVTLDEALTMKTADEMCNIRFEFDRTKDLEKVISWIRKFNGYEDGVEYRKNGFYLDDGICIKSGKFDEGVFRNDILSHDPAGSRFAIKMMSPSIEVVISDLWYDVTTLGNETAHAKITMPDGSGVVFCGSDINNINLFNRNIVESRPWIQKGAKVKLQFSGDLIPVIFPVEFDNYLDYIASIRQK